MQWSWSVRTLALVFPWAIVAGLGLNARFNEDSHVFPEYGEDYGKRWDAYIPYVEQAGRLTQLVESPDSALPAREVSDAWTDAYLSKKIKPIPRVGWDDSVRGGIRAQVHEARRVLVNCLLTSSFRAYQQKDYTLAEADAIRILRLAQILNDSDVASMSVCMSVEGSGLKILRHLPQPLSSSTRYEIDLMLGTKTKSELWQRVVTDEMKLVVWSSSEIHHRRALEERTAAWIQAALTQPEIGPKQKLTLEGANSELATTFSLAKQTLAVIQLRKAEVDYLVGQRPVLVAQSDVR